jgi:hypothetical protein
MAKNLEKDEVVQMKNLTLESKAKYFIDLVE